MNSAKKNHLMKTLSGRIILVTIAAVGLLSAFGVPALGQQAVDREPPQSKIPVTKGERPSPEQPEIARPSAAEVASNYSFNTGTVASLTDMSTGTTQLVAADQDDTPSAVTNIGFDFYFQGARFSQFSANSNGLIRLGGTAVQGASPYKPLAQAGISLITAYGADQRTHAGDGKVHFKVIGSAPNRVLVVEWLNMQSNFNAGGTANLTYQARLIETSGVIEFVYGSMTMTAAGAADVNSRDPNIGFSSSNTAGTVGSVTAAQSGAPPPTFDGSSATAVANLYTAGAITVLNSAAQGSRRFFTFTPPTPTAPTTLSFTAITATGMTLNWVDSPNETIYAIYRSTDGLNYTFDGTAIQNATSYSATGLSPSTNYFWQVYAVSEGALSTALSGSQSSGAPGNISSTAGGGNWSAAGTWVGGVVPSSTDNVTIVTGSTVTIDSSNALNLTIQSGGILQFEATTARTLTVGQAVTINSGGTFQSNPGGTQTGHVLSVGTNLTNNGTLDFSTNANTAGATITFTGAANNTFSGTGATTDIRGITLNKGTSNANILEITTSNLTVQGVNTDVAGFLTLTNGTLKISGTFTMTNRVFLTAIYVIPATGGIWLNNPNFTVAGTNTSTTSGNNGLFRLTQGTYTIGLAIADGFETASATTSYIIEGGTLNANGRFDPQGACTYTQTAGTVNVAVVGNNRSAFGSFEIFSTAATFNMSGGTINLINPSTGATKDDFAMTGQVQNITGGQIVFGGPGAPAASTYGTPFGTSFAPNVVVNPTMTWNINNVTVFFRGTTVTNNGAITSTGTSARFDFANAGAAMNYSGSGTFGTLAAPFGGVGISTNSLFLVTLSSPLVTTRVNLFTGGFVNSNQITLGNGGASTSAVQIGSAGLLTPGGAFDVSPVHNQGTGGQFMIYAQESVLRTTGVEINPTRILNFLSVTNTNNVSIAGGDLSSTSVAASPNNALTLTSGRLITNANTLILPNAASVVVRTTGYVDGNFRKNYSAAASKSFEVGTANGFSPVTVNMTAGTFPADFTVKAVQGPQPNFASPQYALQRYWTLTGTGVTADLTFNYLDPTDIPGTANENAFVIFKYNGAFTTPGGTVTPATNSATITGVSSFSDWTLAQPNAPSAANGSISGVISTPEGQPLGGVSVNLSGTQSARTISNSRGEYRFGNVETDGFYTVTPGLSNYSFSPSSRSFALLGNRTDATFTATANSTATENPLNTGDFFVRQQYLDFLGREPDQQGWRFWTEQLNQCGLDANCIRQKRIDISAAFFQSDEFQLGGNYVYRLYRAALGRRLTYAEFSADRQQVVGGPGLDASRTAFANSFVERPEFMQKYQNVSSGEVFVDALLQTVVQDAGLELSSQREALIQTYNTGADLNHSRSAVLRTVAESSAFKNAVYNNSFVLMEYFGYLQRAPDTAGYNFWVEVLNHRDPGNYRGMVCSFLTSAEYQRRFSPVVIHGNNECGQ
ncbi:MAG: hypothetical protein JWM21_4318 [Acidobacteria bacterium]|nr:hypothetical protein [Acidobacteriota bacterium]